MGSGDDKDVHAMARKFLQPAANYTKNTRSTVLENLQAAERQQKKEMRALRSDAMQAARAIKLVARKAAVASKKAGVPESVYEVVQEGADGISETMQDSAQNLGDQADNAVEDFFQKVEGEVERQLDMKAHEAEQQKRQQERKEEAEKREEQAQQHKENDQAPPLPTPKDELKPDDGSTPPAEALAAITPAYLSVFAFAAIFASAVAAFGLALRSRFHRAEPASSPYERLVA